MNTVLLLAKQLSSDEGLTLETSASDSLYGGQFTLSTQLIKPNYHYLTIRLWARDFYEVIVDEAEGRINYRLIEIGSE